MAARCGRGRRMGQLSVWKSRSRCIVPQGPAGARLSFSAYLFLFPYVIPLSPLLSPSLYYPFSGTPYFAPFLSLPPYARIFMRLVYSYQLLGRVSGGVHNACGSARLLKLRGWGRLSEHLWYSLYAYAMPHLFCVQIGKYATQRC